MPYPTYHVTQSNDIFLLWFYLILLEEKANKTRSFQVCVNVEDSLFEKLVGRSVWLYEFC